VVCLIALAGGLSTDPASGQTGDPTGEDLARGFRLEQNYPNPFSRSTTIPFVLEGDLFKDGADVLVTMRVYNLLQQPLGAPVALGHPAGEGAAVNRLAYSSPGRFEARWDGTDLSGNQLGTGTYLVQLTVNGTSQTLKMLLLR